MVRFMAVALNAFDAGLATVSPRIDAVARTLGRSPPAVLAQVHLPILKGSVLTALLIVFVDTMKELPATLIMRPFNFDTLAVQAHRLAADERLNAAAVPSLVIAAIGLLPVILVCRNIARQGRERGRGGMGGAAGGVRGFSGRGPTMSVGQALAPLALRQLAPGDGSVEAPQAPRLVGPKAGWPRPGRFGRRPSRTGAARARPSRRSCPRP